MLEGREKLVAASLGNKPEQKTKEQTRARATKNSLVALGRWDTITKSVVCDLGTLVQSANGWVTTSTANWKLTGDTQNSIIAIFGDCFDELNLPIEYSAGLAIPLPIRARPGRCNLPRQQHRHDG